MGGERQDSVGGGEGMQEKGERRDGGEGHARAGGEGRERGRRGTKGG